MIHKEGWAIDVASKNRNHYYKDGVSLCGKATQKEYMTGFNKSKDFSVVLGYNCSICEKKINKL
jgi:hypothetical protein